VNGIEQIRKQLRDKPVENWMIWEIALCEIAVQMADIAAQLAEMNARARAEIDADIAQDEARGKL
jgi:hypothetical protein